MNTNENTMQVTAADLMDLFRSAMERRATERRAFEEYGGYSWGYFGASLIIDAEAAEKALQLGLEAFVDERIAKALHKQSNWGGCSIECANAGGCLHPQECKA